MTPNLLADAWPPDSGPRRGLGAAVARLAWLVGHAVARPPRLAGRVPPGGARADARRAAGLAGARAALLSDARTAIRLGCADEADALLARADRLAPGTPPHAELLNLLGVARERRRRWAEARAMYRQAVRADGGCRAARQNVRRLYELDTFGRTAEPVALGDERPALAALLRSRPGSRRHRTTDGEDRS